MSIRMMVSLALVVVLPSTLVATSSGPESDRAPTFRPDRVIFKLRPGVATSLPEHALPAGLPQLDRICRRFGVVGGSRVVRGHGLPIVDPASFERIGLDRTYVMKLRTPDEAAVKALLAELARSPWVEYAEPAWELEPQTTVPNDALFPQQWAHENTGQTGGTVDADMDTPDAWDFGTGVPATVIAVIDTGVDEDHPDLIANLLPGLDLTGSPEGIDDLNDHGTPVAGNAAAVGNNSIGVAGVCWNCAILPIKWLGSAGGATTQEIADGIRWAADSGADVINMSFGGGAWSQVFVDAVDYAYGLGALSVVSSGNGGSYFPLPPSIYPNTVSVGGSIDDDTRFGDYGDHQDVAAPTQSTTTHVDGMYGTFPGTSASAPHVSGLAGLLRSIDPDLHVQELRQLLRLGADDQVGIPSEDTPGWDQYVGYGRINAAGSVALIDGPWIATDRPHYTCNAELFIDLKDETAGATVNVSVTGDIGGDVESVTASPVTAFGYFRGSIALDWVDGGGSVAAGNGRLDVVDGETVTASDGGLNAKTSMTCSKRICLEEPPTPPVLGDCDQDGAADPGETWTIEATFINRQTELIPQVETRLETAVAAIEILQDSASHGDIDPFSPTDPASYSFRVLPGAPAAQQKLLRFAISGDGWESDNPGCSDAGHPRSFMVFVNRDPGGADTWTAEPPTELAGSAASCPGQFDLAWDAVSGAASYNVYRSQSSCPDAEGATTPYASPTGNGFADTAVDFDVDYFYAIEGIEAGTGCVTLRSCIAGGCLCLVPADPSGLRLERVGPDVLLDWDEPGGGVVTWSIYRDGSPDPATWGPAHDAGVSDTDPVTPGIQYTDNGAVASGSPLYYLVTAENGCGESPLR